MRPRYDVCSSLNAVIVPFRIWLILCPRQKPWAVFHRSPGSLVLAVHLLLMNVTWWTVLEWPLQWRHHDHGGVSNHQPHRCLLNRLFRRRSKKSSKLRVTGLCVGNHRGPVNSPHKWPETRKMFPFDDVIMGIFSHILSNIIKTGAGAMHLTQW